MKAGRELDALIAEKVFGCKVIHSVPGAYEFCGCSDRQHAMETKDGQDIKPYSYRIDCAWEVAEKIRKVMAAREFPRTMAILEESRELYEDPDADGIKDGFTVLWPSEYSDDEDGEISGFAPTLPHAICLAALKAIAQA